MLNFSIANKLTLDLINWHLECLLLISIHMTHVTLCRYFRDSNEWQFQSINYYSNKFTLSGEKFIYLLVLVCEQTWSQWMPSKRERERESKCWHESLGDKWDSVCDWTVIERVTSPLSGVQVTLPLVRIFFPARFIQLKKRKLNTRKSGWCDVIAPVKVTTYTVTWIQSNGNLFSLTNKVHWLLNQS